MSVLGIVSDGIAILFEDGKTLAIILTIDVVEHRPPFGELEQDEIVELEGIRSSKRESKSSEGVQVSGGHSHRIHGVSLSDGVPDVPDPSGIQFVVVTFLEHSGQLTLLSDNLQPDSGHDTGLVGVDDSRDIESVELGACFLELVNDNSCGGTIVPVEETTPFLGHVLDIFEVVRLAGDYTLIGEAGTEIFLEPFDT